MKIYDNDDVGDLSRTKKRVGSLHEQGLSISVSVSPLLAPPSPFSPTPPISDVTLRLFQCNAFVAIVPDPFDQFDPQKTLQLQIKQGRA